jgi:hypothetical protein
MPTLKVTAEHVTSTRAYEQVNARNGIDEIDDAVAVTIASWWQSPGYIGKALAALASGAEVDYHALVEDLSLTLKDGGYHDRTMPASDRQALDMLGTWLSQRTQSGTRDYTPAVSPVLRYASIVFQQGDDAQETLDIIGDFGVHAGLVHLRTWQNEVDPYAYETYDNPPHGTDDRVSDLFGRTAVGSARPNASWNSRLPCTRC